MKRIAVLGSTGSVGRQTLDVVRSFPNAFSVVGLAGWTNVPLLQEQLDEFNPVFVSCSDLDNTETSLRLGKSKLTTVVEIACDPQVELVVMAIAGPASVIPTIEALRAGKTVALASKEAIVAAGPIIQQLVAQGATLFPLDSEPSAIWQCLQGEAEISKLIITASGGPFRTFEASQLAKVTAEDALKHPTWSMGKKITIDSATLMNKALEVIESHWMFGVPWEDIEVVVHPQSIIHSFVEYKDGSIKAQMGLPDMKLPIQYALFYPERKENPQIEHLDIAATGALNFAPLLIERYPCFTIALDAGKSGATYPAALCAADDIAVELFLSGSIGFLEIPTLISKVLDEHIPGEAMSLDDILATDRWARNRARELSKLLT